MADPARDSLPLPDYDHLPIGGLESRVRSLGAEEVEELLAYERSHADRLPATELLTARLEQLRSGARPSSGDPGAVRPEQGQGRSGSPCPPRPRRSRSPRRRTARPTRGASRRVTVRSQPARRG